MKTQQQAARAMNKELEQSPKEQLEQQKKQTTILKVATKDKHMFNESKSLLQKKRISNNKGQHI